jgi:hypothetical protein
MAVADNAKGMKRKLSIAIESNRQNGTRVLAKMMVIVFLAILFPKVLKKGTKRNVIINKICMAQGTEL